MPSAPGKPLGSTNGVGLGSLVPIRSGPVPDCTTSQSTVSAIGAVFVLLATVLVITR
jgi:hypothetical protein